MPKYIITTPITISLHTIVEADSAEEAKDIAFARSVQSLCHQCAGSRNDEDEEEWRTSGELDGEPDPNDENVNIELLDE